MPHKKSGLSVTNPEYWELKKKHSFMGDLLKGTYDEVKDIAVGTVETPASVLGGMAGALAALPEAGIRGFDWSDRPEWFMPSMTPSTKKGEGVKGVPFWNKEEAKQGLSEAVDRWTYRPSSRSGKASTDVSNQALGLLDLPFEMFGEGVEGLTGSPLMGDTAYWLTSILGPGRGSRAVGKVAKAGPAGVAADQSKIIRPHWYGGGPSSVLAKLSLPAEMLSGMTRSALGPVSYLRLRNKGISPEAYKALRAADDSLTSGSGKVKGIGNSKMTPIQIKRQHLNDIANQGVQKIMFDPNNPSIAKGTPLSQAANQIFPSMKTVSLTELRSNPSVISDVTGMNIPSSVSKHITPYIEKTFPRVGKVDAPIVIALKPDSAISTGKMMTGPLRAGKRKQPIYAIERAFDSLMTKKSKGLFDSKHTFTVDDFTKEIDSINRKLSTDYHNKLYRYEHRKKKGKQAKKPKEPIYLMKPKQMMGGDGLISWSHAAKTGDYLLGTVTVRTVFDPKTAAMFQLGMDRMAPGFGGGKIASGLSSAAELGMKQHFIAITPQKMSISGDILKKWGLPKADEVLGEMGKGKKAPYPQTFDTMQKLIYPAVNYNPTISKSLKVLGRNVGVPGAQQYGRFEQESGDEIENYFRGLMKRKKRKK